LIIKNISTIFGTSCDILGSLGGQNVDVGLLGCDAVWTFR
jgi:hypothetical protein